MSERDFQSQVLELASLFKWRRAHFRPARTKNGWRTPVEGDAEGFPDLLLLKNDHMIVAECKTDVGVVTADQQAWLDAFDLLPSTIVTVWRPRDLTAIIATLRDPK